MDPDAAELYFYYVRQYGQLHWNGVDAHGAKPEYPADTMETP